MRLSATLTVVLDAAFGENDNGALADVGRGVGGVPEDKENNVSTGAANTG